MSIPKTTKFYFSIPSTAYLPEHIQIPKNAKSGKTWSMKSNNLSNQHQITSTIFQIFPFDWYTIDPPSRIQCAQRRSLDRCSSQAVVSRNLGGGGGNFEILLAFCAPRKWIKLEARRAGARNWSAIDKERGVEPLDEKLYPEEKRPRIRRVWPEWIYMYIRSSLLARTTAWRDTLECCFTFNSNTFLIRRACCVKKRKFRSKKLDCLNRRRRRGCRGDKMIERLRRRMAN